MAVAWHTEVKRSFSHSYESRHSRVLLWPFVAAAGMGLHVV